MKKLLLIIPLIFIGLVKSEIFLIEEKQYEKTKIEVYCVGEYVFIHFVSNPNNDEPSDTKVIQMMRQGVNPVVPMRCKDYKKSK